MFVLIGGLALFLFGIQRLADSLQSAAGPAMRRLLSTATRSPIRAVTTGTLVAAVTQSGTAATVTGLGLVSAGFIAVRDGFALGIGTKLGATMAIQLAAFNIAEIALPLVGIGYILSLVRRAKVLGAFLFGAGLLFLGLDLTVSSLGAMQDSEIFLLMLESAEQQPFVMAFIGFIMGALLSSSNGAAAVALGLSLSGAAGIGATVALVVGGNAGANIMPMIVARTLDARARQVALLMFLFTTAVAIVTLLLLGPIEKIVPLLGGAGRQVANVHTLFNVVTSVLAVLFAGLLAKVAPVLVEERSDRIGAKYLQTASMSNEKLALGMVYREGVRTADKVLAMSEKAVEFLRSGRWDEEVIDYRESQIDALTNEIVDFLARYRRENGTDGPSGKHLLIVTELEHIGDQFRRIMRRERKLVDEGVVFSVEGRKELADTAAWIHERMQRAFTAYALSDRETLEKVVEERKQLEQHVADMRIAHLARLEAQLPESAASSGHHLEILTLLRQIDAGVVRVAGWLLDPGVIPT